MSRARPRIALVVPELEGSGGVRTVATFLLRNVQRVGDFEPFCVSLIAANDSHLGVRLRRPSSWFKPPAIERSTWRGVPLFRVGAAFSELEFQRFRARSALTRLLSTADVIQFIAGSAAWTLVAGDTARPVALQVATRVKWERAMTHGLPLTPRNMWSRAMTTLTDRFEVRGLRAANTVFVENPRMEQYARTVVAGTATRVKYGTPGVDTRVFRPGGPRAPGSATYYLFVGRLNDPRKNVGLLVAAYRRLLLICPDAPDLLLAGSAPPPLKLISKIADWGLSRRVQFRLKPAEEELVKLYRGAVAFVLPSDEEGFGIVLIEAMACGIPVIATRCGGPEGIITQYENGLLVERGNAAALCDAMLRVFMDLGLNAKLGRQGLALVSARYSDEVAAEPFLLEHRRLWESGFAETFGRAGPANGFEERDF